MNRTVSWVMSYQYPGRYAFNVLAGALESDRAPPGVKSYYARDRQHLLTMVKARLAAGDTVVAGWSFYSPSFPPAAEELAWLRAELGAAAGQVLTVVGGVHATAEPEATLRAGFDLVAVGEGEQLLLDLLGRVQRGEDPAAVRGVARLVGGKLVSNGKAEGVDLNQFPPFAAKDRRHGAIEITRGCIYACRFCQTPYMNRARFRHRSVENTVHWVKVLAAAYKRDVRFISPTSFSYGSSDESVNLAALEELLAKVKEAAGPEGRVYYGTFPSEIRPEHISVEALRVLKRYAHNDNVILGGQSGSDRILAASNRGHDVESIVRAARICVEEQLIPNVDFILGLPGETEDDVRATVALMRRLAELGARVHGHTFMPLPGTPWKREAPGEVPAAVMRELDLLASQGHLYGSWRKQMGIAQALKDRRSAPAP